MNVSQIFQIAAILEVPIERLFSVKEEEPMAHNFVFMGHMENRKIKEKSF